MDLKTLVIWFAIWLLGYYTSELRKRLLAPINALLKRLGIVGFSKAVAAISEDIVRHSRNVERAKNDSGYAALLMAAAVWEFLRGSVLMLMGMLVGLTAAFPSRPLPEEPTARIVLQIVSWIVVAICLVFVVRGISSLATAKDMHAAAAKGQSLDELPKKMIETGRADCPQSAA